MHDVDTLTEALGPFIDAGWITEMLHVVKSGKEATVYCCRADESRGRDLIAAKVYRAHRLFRNDVIYQEGRVINNARTRRAVGRKTRYGRSSHDSLWAASEADALRRLRIAGADVPELLATGPDVLLMEYVGDEDSPAPTLQNTHLRRDEARFLFQKLIRDVETWLRCNLVHADLSPFNILYRPGRLTVIDFPQAVDPRFSPHARDLLARDLGNVCRYFSRLGVEADPEKLTARLWDTHLGQGFRGSRQSRDDDDEMPEESEEMDAAPQRESRRPRRGR